MMTDCTLGGGMLDELLTWPTGDLWLHGADGEDDDDAGRDDDDSDDEDEGEDEGDEPKDKPKSGSRSAWKRPSDADIKGMERRIANINEERDRDKGTIKKRDDSIKELKAEISRLKSDGVKDEEVKQRNTELESESARLQRSNDSLRIQIAFLGDASHKWRDPEAAMRLLDTSNIEIDDKGRVTGLKAAADELAESKKYLLVVETEDDEGNQDDQQQRTTRRTGDQPKPRSRSTKAAQEARDSQLRQRFSGLRH